MKKFLFRKLAGTFKLGTVVDIPSTSVITPEILVNDTQSTRQTHKRFADELTNTQLHKWLETSSGYHLTYSFHIDTSFVDLTAWYQPIFYYMRISSIRFLDPTDAVTFRLTF